jgi:HD-GYP domain-containing protein (c-di-GMP phosphodiesterase class II)
MEKVPIYDLLRCFSSAIDMVAPEITNHHNQVGYLVFRLGEHMHWTNQELEALLSAGLTTILGRCPLRKG